MDALDGARGVHDTTASAFSAYPTPINHPTNNTLSATTPDSVFPHSATGDSASAPSHLFQPPPSTHNSLPPSHALPRSLTHPTAGLDPDMMPPSAFVHRGVNSNPIAARQHSNSDVLRGFSNDMMAHAPMGLATDPYHQMPGGLTDSLLGLPPTFSTRPTDLDFSILSSKSMSSPVSSLAATPPSLSHSGIPLASSGGSYGSGFHPNASSMGGMQSTGLPPPGMSLMPGSATPVLTAASMAPPVNPAQLAQLLQTGQPSLLTQIVALVGNGQTQGPLQPPPEEISTIFVVGFPEDMTEREFQNMFTFCQGYEAATLKVPPKEHSLTSAPTQAASVNGGLRPNYPSNGSSAAAIANAAASALAGANDPYNLVTMNSGGVVVDQGNNQATTSVGWPSGLDESYARSLLAMAASSNPSDANQLASSQQRKQIIGFAKFRSRQEAMDARDILHGRRVDVEKGAVLKAEMAKKNLHTKRGVGPLQTATALPAGGLPGDPMAAPNAGMLSPTAAGALGMSGYHLSDSSLGAANGATYGSLSGRSSDVADAFKVSAANSYAAHGILDEPHRISLESHASMVSGDPNQIWSYEPMAQAQQTEPAPSRKATMSSDSLQSSTMSPPHRSVVETFRPSIVTEMMVSSIGSLSGQPGSASSGSPPNTSYQPDAEAVLSGYASDSLSAAGKSTRSFSPPDPTGYMSQSSVDTSGGTQESIGTISASFIPSARTIASTMSVGSGSSSLANSFIANEGAFAPQSDLLLGTRMTGQGPHTVGFTSGPDSVRGSFETNSRSGRNASDQNPPINTLYVGNLPTNLPNIQATKMLEDSLTVLFQSRLGYRKLSFKQKNNSTMCFVEFDDVTNATRALNELYGNTVNGLVKNGGIRLSYSKNPLGVRTAPGERLVSPLASPTSQVPVSFASMGALQDSYSGKQGIPITQLSDMGSRFRAEDLGPASPPLHRYQHPASPPNGSASPFMSVSNKPLTRTGSNVALGGGGSTFSLPASPPNGPSPTYQIQPNYQNYPKDAYDLNGL